MFMGLSLTTGLLWTWEPLPISQLAEAAALGQAIAATPIRLGDVARQLPDQEIAAIAQAMPTGGKPWLLIGEKLSAMSLPILSVEAFLPPETTTREVRRGMRIPLSRSISDQAKPEPWTISAANYPRGRIGSYAQVAVAGRNFDDMQGDQDINRPFVVEGRFEDAELISIVSFIRSIPLMPTARLPIRAGPIHTLVRETAESVTVWTRLDFSSSQIVTLRKEGERWVITATSIRSA